MAATTRRAGLAAVGLVVAFGAGWAPSAAAAAVSPTAAVTTTTPPDDSAAG